MVTNIVIPVVFAFILDRLFGDPEKLPHPIVYIGRLISTLTKTLLKEKDSNQLKFLKGIAIVVITEAIVVIPIIFIDINIIGIIKIIFRTVLLYFAIAMQTLSKEAKMVYEKTEISLRDAQNQVARIVGRDTNVLDMTGVIKATVETVAENTSDGVTAPYFYFILFGPAGAYFYKVANTFDSMIAYHNDRFEYFGKFAAKLDDILNFIPSRLTGITACLCAPVVGGSIFKSFKVFLEDRYKHKSPNSAQCESAFAGALNVRLLGDAMYEGKIEKKQFINESGRVVNKKDILRSILLMRVLTYSFIIITLLIHLILFKFTNN